MAFRLGSSTLRPQPVTFNYDGVAITAYPGETLAAALMAADIRGFRRDLRGGLRGPYCNMGTCFECVLEVRSGGTWRTSRACLTQVVAGLDARSLQAPKLEGSTT